FFICETLRPESSSLTLLQLLDPSSFVYTTLTIDTIPVADRNVAFLPLTKLFWLNRAIWVGFSLLMLGIAYRSFSFKRFLVGNDRSNKGKQIKEQADSLWGVNTSLDLPSVQLRYRFTDLVSKLFRLASMEVKNVVRAPGFRILLLVLSIVFFVFNLLWNSSFFIGASYPLTSTMTLTRISMGTWVSFILMIWTTELLFKDRVVGFWQVNDALPAPVWVTVLSKFLAMSVVALLISCMFIVFGIGAQLYKGAPDEIDVSLYVTDLLGYNWGWLNYLQMLAMVCLIAGLTAHRFATHLLSIGIYFFNLISFDLEIIEELRFIYMAVPGVDDYSEMNGYGIWSTSIPWFFLMWTTLAIAFVALGVYFWKRGASHQFKQKLSFRGTQLNGVGKALVGVCLIGFFYMQYVIVDQVHAKGNFESKRQQQEKDAAYEKTYKKLADDPQPKITDVDLSLDFYPESRSADFEASYTLSNPHASSIDTLYLTFPDFTRYEAFTWNGREVQPVWTDTELGMMALAIGMLGDTTGTLAIQGSRVHTGFTQDKNTQQPELTYNGSFLRAQDLLPTIGYDDALELTENRYRRDWGLDKLGPRMSPISDSMALGEDVYSSDAAWLKGTIELSTTSDQVAIGPGELTKSWQAAGRNHYTYALEHAAPFEWYFGSASYDQFSFNHDRVHCHIYHQPSHRYNLPFFEKSFRSALDFIASNLGEYPYREVKLVEIPFYQEPTYAFPNTIAMSEKEGWFADSNSLDNQVYMAFTIASSLISHWVMQHVPIANVQGADMLRYALPECLAIQVIQAQYGQEGLDWLLTKKQGLYSRERGNEPNVEPSLLYADGIDYLERNKGTIELYRLSQSMSPGQFNQSIKTWASGLTAKGAFHDLYATLLTHEQIAMLPEQQIQAIKTAFEEVTP
ncbi:MAG: hypothetical protein AAF804_05040, partial [Bacteroidota bacterium]